MDTLLQILSALDSYYEVTFRRYGTNEMQIILRDPRPEPMKSVMRTVRAPMLVKFQGGVDKALSLELRDAREQLADDANHDEKPQRGEG